MIFKCKNKLNGIIFVLLTVAFLATIFWLRFGKKLSYDEPHPEPEPDTELFILLPILSILKRNI